MFNSNGDLFFNVETGIDSFPFGLILMDILFQLKGAKGFKFHDEASGFSFFQGNYDLPSDSLIPYVMGNFFGSVFYLYEMHTGLKHVKRHRFNGIVTNSGSQFHFYTGNVSGTKSGA
jgi:hypothetical protein